jgi:hypothetical protein
MVRCEADCLSWMCYGVMGSMGMVWGSEGKERGAMHVLGGIWHLRSSVFFSFLGSSGSLRCWRLTETRRGVMLDTEKYEDLFEMRVATMARGWIARYSKTV